MNFVDDYLLADRGSAVANRDLTKLIIDLAEPLPEPEPVLRVGGVLTASRGNISTIVGLAKSRKTFLTGAMASGFLSASDFMGIDTPQHGRVVYVDTEQAASHVHRLARRILRSIGLPDDRNHERLTVAALRELAPAERLRATAELLERCRPELLIIDGIADLCADINDPRESEQLTGELMRWSSLYDNHILCVLHTNPGGDKARGHLGSALLRKSETVVLVKADGEVSVVRPQYCRNMPFTDFAFQVSPAGIPEECPMPEPSDSANAAKTNLFAQIMEVGRTYTTSELVELLMKHESLTHSGSRVKILRAVKSGYISQTQRGLYYID